MTSRTHDNFRHNFWTWVDPPPPVWTMFKKTSLFPRDGFPKGSLQKGIYGNFNGICHLGKVLRKKVAVPLDFVQSPNYVQNTFWQSGNYSKCFLNKNKLKKSLWHSLCFVCFVLALVVRGQQKALSPIFIFSCDMLCFLASTRGA